MRQNQFVVCAFVTAIVLTLPQVSGASLLVYEPFDYPAGAFGGANGGSGFLAPWSGNDPAFSIRSGNLQAAGYVSRGNEAHYLANGYFHYDRMLSGQYGADGTDLWASYLTQPQSSGAFTSLAIGQLISGNLHFGILGNPNGSGLGPPSSTWGMDTFGGAGQVFSNVPVVYGQTVRLVVHIQFLPGPDHIDLYVNPAPSATPSSPDATKTDLDLSRTLQSFPPSISLAANIGDVAYDDIRLGTTYSDVVPAPTLGDFNLDGKTSNADIQAMANALADFRSYASVQGLSDSALLLLGDLNGDGVVSNADLQSLLAAWGSIQLWSNASCKNLGRQLASHHSSGVISPGC